MRPMLLAKFCATYGNKYMYAAGHATTWTGVDPEEIVEVVFGSREDAEKRIDVDSFYFQCGRDRRTCLF